MNGPKLPLTKNIEIGRAPFTLAQYQAAGGYVSVTKALAMEPKAVREQVKDSGLGGRGGAGFNTGLKWSFVPEPDGGPRYLVVNGDEMEPGTFKDRLLMEYDPHLLVEGVITSSIAIQASQAYIFLRGEYKAAEKALQQAIKEAYEAGFLGKNIQGSNFSLDLCLHTSAGRYICGEETALINALEGKRANPRFKPPFPQVSGLWGRPTVVNNVETICNVPGIISYGVEWFKSLGINGQTGTRISGVSGRVKNPGCWEMPVGTTFRTLFEDFAGGMLDGYEMKAFLPGGGSTDFLLPEHLDLPMIPGDVAKAGSRLGTSLIMVLDDKTCPIGCIENLMKFFAHESCGWCTPCRDGLPWTEHMMHKLETGTGSMEDIERLEEMTRYMAPGNTFCALAPGAAEPLQSGLKHFRDEFIEHVQHGCKYKQH